MTGKWHLAFGGVTATLPHNRGFDKTFILDATGNNFNHHSCCLLFGIALVQNGQETELPEDLFDEFFVDQMIEFIDEDITDEAPFFSYVSFEAQLCSIQAPKNLLIST